MLNIAQHFSSGKADITWCKQQLKILKTTGKHSEWKNFANCGHQATETITSISSRLIIGGSRGRRPGNAPPLQTIIVLNSMGFCKGT